MDNKWERRESKRNKRRKMRVDGRSVKLLQEIIERKAKLTRKKEEPYY